MHRRRWHGIARRWLLLPLVTVLGCGTTLPPAVEEPSNRAEEAGTNFDPATAGTIQGRVTWEGPIPVVAPFEVLPNPLAGEALQKRQLRPNPNAPFIDAGTKGVANAVVFLRGMDPKQGKRWDLPPVRVEQRDGQFHVIQGAADAPFGFVRRGDGLEMISRDHFFHALHSGGAAFFTLTFPDPDRPLQRSLKEKGIVELTSAAGYYWMRAYLFVDDHPYFTRTNADGRFVLAQVPPGRYEVVCWLPNWAKDRHERDPESGLIARHFFKGPVEQIQLLNIAPTESKEIQFVCSTGVFMR